MGAFVGPNLLRNRMPNYIEECVCQELPRKINH